jgi:DNA-binding Lrp family transcriptional regulator
MVDAVDLAFVNAWQRGFPLCARPFQVIGLSSHLPEGDAIGTFKRLKSAGVIDRVGPVFRPNTVGVSTLAAIAVPPERLAQVAAQVSAQPGVNHNYERENAYNLWFVVTAPNASALQWRISCIEYATGLPVAQMPLQEEFHIDLGFDLDTRAAPRAERPASVPPLAEEESRLVRAVSPGFRLVAEPFKDLAGMPEGEAIRLLQRMLDDGRIRRIGAIVRHRRLGYEANAMVVWDVPDREAGALGRRLAADRAVTLCYRRARVLPRWPYNFYCMVHGRERARVAQDIERLTVEHGLERYDREVLFSTRCFSQKAASYA